MQPFLSVEEYRAYSMGGDVAPPGHDAEVYRALQAATALLNEAAQGWLVYHQVADEMHKVRYAPNGALYFRLREKPVRQILSMSLAAGQYAGGRIPLGFDTGPDEIGPQLPVIQGQIVVNRNSSSIYVTGPQVLYAPPGIGLVWNAPVTISYTCGYDDGTVQSDGLVYPAPDWVREATRITVRKLLMEGRRVRAGRGLKGTYTTGDISESVAEDADAELPQHVRSMVERHMQHYTIGA